MKLEDILNYDLNHPDQYRCNLRINRVRREFLIDRAITDFGDREYERVIQNNKLVKKKTHKVPGFSSPSTNAIRKFCKGEHKRRPDPNVTRAIETYLLEKYNLPKMFFVVDPTIVKMAKAARDSYAPSSIPGFYEKYEKELNGIFMLSGMQAPYNFSIAILTEYDEKNRVLLARAVVECDQHERNLIFADDEFESHWLCPSKYTTFNYSGYAYADGSSFVIMLRNPARHREFRIDLSLLHVVADYGKNVLTCEGAGHFVTSISVPKECWTVRWIQDEQSPCLVKLRAPVEIDDIVKSVNHLSGLIKANPSVNVINEMGESETFIINDFFNLFLIKDDDLVPSINNVFGRAPGQNGSSDTIISSQYLNNAIMMGIKYYNNNGEYINEFAQTMKSIYTL